MLLYDFAVYFFLQQEQVLSELVWYINQDPPPPNKDTASEVLAYLEACSLPFEKGFLSHDRVRSFDGDVIKNIDKGFQYFTAWIDSLLDKGMDRVYQHFYLQL